MRGIIIIGVFVGKRGENGTTNVRRRRWRSMDIAFECPNVYESGRSVRMTVMRDIVLV